MTSTSIPLFQVHLPPASALMPRLEQTLYSGQISEGPVVYAFEDRFASFIAMPGRALSFYSGTAALHAALLLAGV
jgi:dTDP-4-amino-4,6-dideoxygalactose transaminase